MKNKKLLGILILMFTAFIWGMAFAFQSQAGELMGPLTIGAARMTLAAVETGILCLVLDLKAGKTRENTDPEYKKNTIKGGLICGVFMGIAATIQQIGINYTTAGKAGFITALYMIFVPIIAAVIFRQRPGFRTWFAVIIAIIGMYLLTMKNMEGLSRGDIYILICAVFFALQILFAEKYVSNANAVKMACIEFILIAVCSWILAFIFEHPTMEALRAGLIPVLYCGCISGGVGYTLQLVGQKFTDSVSASIAMSFESVFAVVGGVLILGEKMTLRELLGCGIMFAAIILVQLPEKKKVRVSQG